MSAVREKLRRQLPREQGRPRLPPKRGFGPARDGPRARERQTVLEQVIAHQVELGLKQDGAGRARELSLEASTAASAWPPRSAAPAPTPDTARSPRVTSSPRRAPRRPRPARARNKLRILGAASPSGVAQGAPRRGRARRSRSDAGHREPAATPRAPLGPFPAAPSEGPERRARGVPALRSEAGATEPACARAGPS